MRDHVDVQKEMWKIVLVRPSGSELLLVDGDGGFTLPRVEIPTGGRVALALNAAMMTAWNLDVFSLSPLQPATTSLNGSILRVYLAEAVERDAMAPIAARWFPISNLRRAAFAEAREWAAIRSWRDDFTRSCSIGNRALWGSPGTFGQILTWVRQALQPRGSAPTGQFVQFNAGKHFSLVRFATSGDAVWFKAVGEPNRREFAVTVLLSSILPSYVPQLLATNARWNAWLATEVPGLRLSQCQDLTAWSRAARDLARLQVSSSSRVGLLLKSGARDARIPELLGQIKPFFTVLDELMERQTKPLPARLSREEVDQLKSDMHYALDCLGEEQIPDSLGHLDLNPENIIARNARTIFLDWAEASVGHPFLSLAFLLEHYRNTFGNAGEGHSHLIREYLKAWESKRAAEQRERRVCVALLLAIFAHAVSTDVWRDETRLQEPRMAGYYRSLGRRMNRYAKRIRNGAQDVSELWT